MAFTWLLTVEKFEIFGSTCRDWGIRFMRLFPQYTSWENPKDPERPLVIGYVSPDYFTHSVSYFIEAPLAHHDYANYKVVVYSAVVKVILGYSSRSIKYLSCPLLPVRGSISYVISYLIHYHFIFVK